MMLPYDPALSYWLRALPQFEWQPEPQDLAQSSTAEPTPGVCADPSPPGDPPACTGAGDDVPQGPPLPRLRLVMTGIRWVAVPYWAPRENPHWETMAQDGREEDRRRIDTASLHARRSPDSAGGGDEVPSDGNPG
jgi:hypothetical protein